VTRFHRPAVQRSFAVVEILFSDFDGVLTDDLVRVDSDGKEQVQCCRSDGIGISILKSVGIPTVVISSEVNPVVGVRCRKLEVDCHSGVLNKADKIVEICAFLGVPLSRAAFVGNDVNDLDALAVVGLPLAVQNCHGLVRRSSIFVTRARGGHGAIREIAELIVAARSNSRSERKPSN